MNDWGAGGKTGVPRGCPVDQATASDPRGGDSVGSSSIALLLTAERC